MNQVKEDSQVHLVHQVYPENVAVLVIQVNKVHLEHLAKKENRADLVKQVCVESKGYRDAQERQECKGLVGKGVLLVLLEPLVRWVVQENKACVVSKASGEKLVCQALQVNLAGKASKD